MSEHGREGYLSIGDFARASGLSPKALRLYDETGLLAPAEVDGFSGYRYYAPGQLGRARLVARLRLLGMPLARIAEVADLPDRAAAAALTSYWRQVEADTASARSLVSDLLAEIDEETSMNTIQTQRPPVAALRGGRGARESQLDAARCSDGVYAVADGFGDAEGLAESVVALVVDEVTALPVGADVVGGLDGAFARAVGVIARGWAEHPGAGTTLTVVALRGDQAVIAHLGDSRVYRVREGRLERLTRDHTVVQTLIDEGRLTEDEARQDDRRVQLNRAVSVDVPCTPDLAVHTVAPGDRFVLTTDGVHRELEPADLADLLVAGVSPAEVAEAVNAAVEAAGAPDNHHVLVVDVAG